MPHPDRTRISVELDNADIDRLRVIARSRNCSLSELLRTIIQEHRELAVIHREKLIKDVLG